MDMRRHFEREIERINKNLLRVGTMVEESVGASIRAVVNRNRKAAEEVIKSDEEIDAKELLIEEECLKILALYQPVASDLRFIVAVVKINNDLERMGDLSVNIAERALYLGERPIVEIPPRLHEFSDHVRRMVKDVLDALVNHDAGLALTVTRADDRADEIHGELIDYFQTEMTAGPDRIDLLIPLMFISRHLERIADHATNIAEDIYYLVKGDIIRHHTREFDKKAGFPGKKD